MPDGTAHLSSSRAPRRLRRLIVATFAATAALATVLSSQAAACPFRQLPFQVSHEYIALGDSFSAGVGTGDYDPSSGDCLRSPKAYAPLWAADHPSYSLDFRACSGATSKDVLALQLEDLSGDSALITVTAGGNDIGFSTILGTCLRADEEGCAVAVEKAGTIVDEELPGLLESLYEEIEDRAPSARVVVLGYPKMFDTSGECPQSGLSPESRTIINDGTQLLDDTIRATAREAGLTFVDVQPVFTGHEVCSADPWLNGLTSSEYDSFHPNAKGYALGYRAALASVVG
jgi:lysophospholipase L1-like esterase